LAGTMESPSPDLVARTDGRCLLYRGRLHFVYSEPEGGKTWFCSVAAADCIDAGLDVAYFDLEDSPESVCSRLLAMGVDRHLMLEHFRYFAPPGPITNDILEMYRTDELAGVALVVVDGMTNALVADGVDPDSNKDVAGWLGRLPRVGREAGAAVILSDHVTKSRESRGRWAIGAQHKIAATHVAYSLTVKEPLAPGRVGRVLLTIQKDRPGGLRRFALEARHAAEMVIDARDEANIMVTFEPCEGAGWAPTERMDEILQAARRVPGPRSKTALAGLVSGKKETNLQAVEALIRNGDLVRVGGSDKVPTYEPIPEEEAQT
jgi:hypothetical protein